MTREEREAENERCMLESDALDDLADDLARARSPIGKHAITCVWNDLYPGSSKYDARKDKHHWAIQLGPDGMDSYVRQQCEECGLQRHKRYASMTWIYNQKPADCEEIKMRKALK
jgi:hypothetical protein